MRSGILTEHIKAVGDVQWKWEQQAATVIFLSPAGDTVVLDAVLFARLQKPAAAGAGRGSRSGLGIFRDIIHRHPKCVSKL